MFPVEFPLRVLRRRANESDWVLDPFCGRGTTNYAARSLGLPSVGIDSSRVAAAITQGKLANTRPTAIMSCAEKILKDSDLRTDVPTGEFWRWGFNETTLHDICKLRTALILDCRSDRRKALRAILLGALHGPVSRGVGYLSNQCTRTYAPKPGYAVRFWKTRGMSPPSVDVLKVVASRAQRYYGAERYALGFAFHGDSRDSATFERFGAIQFRWIVTSPPYYGMRTYVPDQWLRHWFVGGPPSVEYASPSQIAHSSPETFANELYSVWSNAARVATPDARLVVRFGGIADREAEPVEILKASLEGSPWLLETIKPAGSADRGRRQAFHFAGKLGRAREEYDAWAMLA